MAQPGYPATTELTRAAIVRGRRYVRQRAASWDYRPLGATLDQLQTVRQYYDFTDVNIDRYPIDGKRRQVMLSARGRWPSTGCRRRPPG
ncbi:MAG: UPF0182 family protein [Chloroflexota bacterium]